MIRLSLIGNDYHYELENIIRLFYPAQKVSADSGDFMQITAQVEQTQLAVCVIYGAQTAQREIRRQDPAQDEILLCKLLFEILSDYTGLRPGWGLQTGVRPVKLLRSLEQQYGEQQAKDRFENRLLVSAEKYALAKRVARLENEMLCKLYSNGFSLYVSIPFCKSRCSYCSFVSHDISKSRKLIPDYVTLLCREIALTGEIVRKLGLRLQTVYFGGGTPTAIDDGMLLEITEAICRSFDCSGLQEFTIEAGRPDTITMEKLQEIRACGAQRISINPQTLNDTVLRNIRRSHTAQQFYQAYDLAAQCGFTNVNTDLIAGLDGDTPASFAQTMEEILRLAPACVTVHTLSVKRSSTMVYRGVQRYDAGGDAVSQMLAGAYPALTDAGYRPYYMYRQSRMAGNHENTGWSKPGFESLYNMLIMEEVQTVLAVGAGASTKLVSGNQIQRIFNYKYPYEYIRGFDEMCRRKQQICEFYKKTAE